jgi:hypothetical protein
VVGAHVAKSQQRLRNELYFSCTSSSPGTMKIKIKPGTASLRKVLGKKLRLGVVRAAGAAQRDATITFRLR